MGVLLLELGLYFSLFHLLQPKDVGPERLRILKSSSEVSANILHDPLEGSVEVGVETALSSSHNDTTGQELMTQHLGKYPSGLRLEQAFFKPIQSKLESETDESKLGSEKRSSASYSTNDTTKLCRPIIYVNDTEMNLSPMSPPTAMGGGAPQTGFPEFPDPAEEVRRILARKLQVEHGGLRTGGDSASSSRCSSAGPRSRRESINQLQKLQLNSKIPKLGGKVSQCGGLVCSHALRLGLYPSFIAKLKLGWWLEVECGYDKLF